LTAAAEAVCPYCRSGFEAEDEVKPCPACNTPHHADCFAENGGCTIFGCTAAPAEEPKITLTPTDLHPPYPVQPPAHSFYNLNAAQPAPSPAQPSAAPPPPLPSGSSAPPPPLAMTPYAPQQYGLAQPFPAYAYGSYVKPKSRVTFVLLAIFLGPVGAHNFYAGYNKKAVIQLCISVFTCFGASFVPWIWAIVEACTVTMDDDGVLLS
jgi:TM2 domain-containing membrane protein YozV